MGTLDSDHQEEMRKLEEIKEAAYTSPLKDAVLVVSGGVLGQATWVYSTYGFIWLGITILLATSLLFLAVWSDRQ